MSSFRLEHATESEAFAEYGLDHAVGYFVSVKRPKQRRIEYDRLQPGYADLEGALRFFVTHGFFDQEALEDAKIWLADDAGEGATTPDVFRAATVICALKEWSPPRGRVRTTEESESTPIETDGDVGDDPEPGRRR